MFSANVFLLIALVPIFSESCVHFNDDGNPDSVISHRHRLRPALQRHARASRMMPLSMMQPHFMQENQLVPPLPRGAIISPEFMPPTRPVSAVILPQAPMQEFPQILPNNPMNNPLFALIMSAYLRLVALTQLAMQNTNLFDNNQIIDPTENDMDIPSNLLVDSEQLKIEAREKIKNDLLQRHQELADQQERGIEGEQRLKRDYESEIQRQEEFSKVQGEKEELENQRKELERKLREKEEIEMEKFAAQQRILEENKKELEKEERDREKREAEELRLKQLEENRLKRRKAKELKTLEKVESEPTNVDGQKPIRRIRSTRKTKPREMKTSNAVTDAKAEKDIGQ